MLERNPQWRGPAPHFDEIRVLPLDFKKALTGYDAHDLDMTKVNINSIPLLRKRRDATTTLTVRPALAYTWLGMNVDHPKLADIRVRRRIQHAVRRLGGGARHVRRGSSRRPRAWCRRSFRAHARGGCTPTIRRRRAGCWPRPACGTCP